MKNITEKIIEILEDNFDDPAKIDDWTTIYMQDKFIKIAKEIGKLISSTKQKQQNKEWEENYYPEMTDTPMTMTGDFFESKLKDEIISAEKILSKHIEFFASWDLVIEAMEEYANQFKKK